MKTTSKRVAILGAGLSGLVSIKSCLEEGLNPICYEQFDSIGGLWNYSENVRPNSGGSVYSSLTTNTCKTTMCFSDFPFPKEESMYMPHCHYWKYLNDYAQHFDLLKYINFNCQILHVEPAKDYDETGRWTIDLKNIKSNLTASETFNHVIVCTGVMKDSIFPNIPGMNKFKGEILHSKEYRKPEIFANKRILIIGNSNSAGDIAVDACNHTNCQVYLSTGSGMWIISRISNGKPIEFLQTRFGLYFPKFFIEQFIQKHGNSRISHQCLGLNSKAFYNSAVMISEDIQYKILSGQLLLKNHVIEFNKSGVKFDDDSSADFDLVVCATGYKIGLEILDDSIVAKNHGDIQLYKMTWPVNLSHPTLAFVGIFQSMGAHPPVAELQARWIAKLFSNGGKLPSKDIMLHEIVEAKDKMYKQYGKHVFRFPNLSFRDSIAEEIGVKPHFWKIFLKNPILAFLCWFGPAFPAQHRLQGPHRWQGAIQVCYSSYNDTMQANKLNRSLENKILIPSVIKYCCILGIFLAIFVLIY